MQRYLKPDEPSSGRKICVLYGPGGIGKTQLAIEYATLHQKRYTSFFWIDAKTEESLIQSCLSIAPRIPGDKFPVPKAPDAGSFQDLKERAKEVLAWFGYEGNDRWLLIFDNVDKTSYEASTDDSESRMAYDITDYFPDGDMGTIIITTRLPRLSTLGGFVEVGKIDLLSGLLILENRSRKSLKIKPGENDTESKIADVQDYSQGKILPNSYISTKCPSAYWLNFY